MTDVPVIKIVPYVWYNQHQALTFWLNETQGIIMNYLSLILPSWCKDHLIDDKWNIFYWCSIGKPLSDMPTLKVGVSTMRTHIALLEKKGLIQRKYNPQRTKCYYRVTSKWYYWYIDQGAPSDFKTLYNIIEEKISLWEISEAQQDKMLSLLSGEKEKQKIETFIDLDDVRWSDIINLIVDEIRNANKEWWIKLQSKEKFNKEYIQFLAKHILSLWENTWLELDPQWKPTEKTRSKIKRKLNTMFNWYKDNGKTIRSLRQTLDTFFSKDWI